MNHAITGGLLATKWQLPETVCAIIEHHHNPSFLDIDSIPEDILRETALVSIADILVNRIIDKKSTAPDPEIEFFALLDMAYPPRREYHTRTGKAADERDEVRKIDGVTEGTAAGKNTSAHPEREYSFTV